VLDTETTDLEGYACDIAVLDMSGVVLLDTILNAAAPVNPQARAAHGITDEQMAAAPKFAAIWPQLRNILHDRRIVTWNAPFDMSIVRRDVLRIGEPDPALTWECAMRWHAQWVGDWDEHHQHWRWSRLNGGHRAASDCRAVIERLKEMANDE
jgi:DNA polymerase III epsilon subunit-like protein